jgi:hypothetical protein
MKKMPYVEVLMALCSLRWLECARLEWISAWRLHWGLVLNSQRGRHTLFTTMPPRLWAIKIMGLLSV